MARERTPVLAVWDMRRVNGELKGPIEYYYADDTAGERLRVRWDVETRPPEFFPAHDGVLYVLDSPNVRREPGSPDMTPIEVPGGRLRWHEGDFVPGTPWVMMALIRSVTP